jgi:hypothetical protein
MAYKTFVNGFPLNASELNTYLMSQTIATFANTTARDEAIGSPAEGQVVYIENTASFLWWTGADWEEFGSLPTLTANRAVATDGSGELTASTVTATELGYLSGVTSSIQTQIDGAGSYKLLTSQSFSASTAVNVNNVFSSSYENYQIFCSWKGSATHQAYLRWRVSGADDTNTKYNLGAWVGNNSYLNEDMTNAHTLGFYDSGWPGSHTRLEVYSPQLTAPTKITVQHTGGRSGVTVTAGHVGQGGHVNATSFTGFTIYPSTGNITGTVRIYGLAN